MIKFKVTDFIAGGPRVARLFIIPFGPLLMLNK